MGFQTVALQCKEKLRTVSVLICLVNFLDICALLENISDQESSVRFNVPNISLTLSLKGASHWVMIVEPFISKPLQNLLFSSQVKSTMKF